MNRSRWILTTVVTALAFGMVLPAAAIAAGPAAGSRSGKAIIGYVFPRKDPLAVDSIQAEFLTHINYAFANIRNGRVALERPDDPENLKMLVALRKPHPHLKVLVSVGGWSWSGGFSDMSLTRASRAKFIDSAIALVREHDLDGIDLDWEYPGLPGAGNVHRPEDKKNFTLLLGELRRALNTARRQTGRPYLLTIAAGASQSFLDHTQMGRAQRNLDYVNLMTYDFFVEKGGKSGHHSNLYASAFNPSAPSASASVSAFVKAGVPARKIILGVPFYGRGWKGAARENNGLYQDASAAEGGYSWNNLSQSFIGKNGYVRWWDSGARAPYLWKADEGRIVTYDDPDSLGEKCRYVKKRRLGGVMFWEYTADDPAHTLLRTLYKNLQ